MIEKIDFMKRDGFVSWNFIKFQLKFMKKKEKQTKGETNYG